MIKREPIQDLYFDLNKDLPKFSRFVCKDLNQAWAAIEELQEKLVSKNFVRMIVPDPESSAKDEEIRRLNEKMKSLIAASENFRDYFKYMAPADIDDEFGAAIRKAKG